jgi:UDP-N-acetylglucosamine 2-epimerase (non-hydrolysing)
MGRMRIDCVVGTRPEAIKLAPVVQRLRGTAISDGVRLVHTGQQRELARGILEEFGLRPDVELAGVHAGTVTLGSSLGRLVSELDGLWHSDRPDVVLAVGDTTSVLAAALAAHSQRIRFGHLEAGLRSGRRDAPYPEETYRVLVAQLADLHFAPTVLAERHLRAEGVDGRKIHLVGNPVVDAVREMSDGGFESLPIEVPTVRFGLMTLHRREHWGEPMAEVARGILAVVEREGDLSLVVPLHPNPQVRGVIGGELGNHERIKLIDPLGYRDFLRMMRASLFIVTDSGGVQEEAPVLGKRLVVVRASTERPEGVAAGVAWAVEPDREAVRRAVEGVIRDLRVVGGGSRHAPDCYGDGRASERIVAILGSLYGFSTGRVDPGLWEWPKRVRHATGHDAARCPANQERQQGLRGRRMAL